MQPPTPLVQSYTWSYTSFLSFFFIFFPPLFQAHVISIFHIPDSHLTHESTPNYLFLNPWYWYVPRIINTRHCVVLSQCKLITHQRQLLLCPTQRRRPSKMSFDAMACHAVLCRNTTSNSACSFGPHDIILRCRSYIERQSQLSRR